MSIKIGLAKTDLGNYVGRPTPLGNPFIISKFCSRDEACDQYIDWFNNQLLTSDVKFHSQLRGLAQKYREQGELTLLCYCHPKRCHAETIRNWIYEHEA